MVCEIKYDSANWFQFSWIFRNLLIMCQCISYSRHSPITKYIYMLLRLRLSLLRINPTSVEMSHLQFHLFIYYWISICSTDLLLSSILLCHKSSPFSILLIQLYRKISKCLSDQFSVFRDTFLVIPNFVILFCETKWFRKSI